MSRRFQTPGGSMRCSNDWGKKSAFCWSEIETVWMKKVVRQQAPGYRRAVELVQEGEFREAVELLYEQGRIVEIGDESDRIMALAERYVAQPEGNLAVVPGNRERVFANAVIHGML